MRRVFLLLHRYVGLSLAGFLILAGLTGSVITFYDELDQWLNPGWFKVEADGEQLPASDWVKRVESKLPGLQVYYVEFPRQAKDTATLWLASREDEEIPDFDHIFLNPYTGEILGQRTWGALRLDRQHIIPFIYKLHYTLHLGETGVFIFGVVALVWFFDCFVGLYLGWPRRTWKAIKAAFSVKWRASGARVNYDLHRASGLLLWIVLAAVAFSGMAMNLRDEVFEPVVGVFSRISPWPEEAWPERTEPESPFKLSIAEALQAATAHLEADAAEAGGVGINHDKGTYRVLFYSDVNIMKNHLETQIFVSGETGEVVGERIPGEGTAGDVFSQWQYPLHSGKAFGLPGRILICLGGLATALLSVTGVLMWWRKRSRKRDVRVGTPTL